MKDSVVEALKELVRTFILGMIPVFITVLGVINTGIDVKVGGFSIQWILVLSVMTSGVISVIQTALMSAADKWLHENKVRTPLELKGMDSLKK